jgi:hypothetical protein
MADVQSVIDDMRDELMRAIPGSFVSIVPITEDVNCQSASKVDPFSDPGG